MCFQNRISQLVDKEEYIIVKEKVIEWGDDMFGKNKRIYFQNVPDVTELPKIEPMMKAVTVEIQVTTLINH